MRSGANRAVTGDGPASGAGSRVDTALASGSLPATVPATVDVIDPPFDAVCTLAGTGKPGFTDGPLREAYFDHPGDVCTLKDGTFLVADTRNNVLRRVVLRRPDPADGSGGNSGDSAGASCVSTVETLETHALLGPVGLLPIDGGSAVVLCDSGHHKIRLLRFDFDSLDERPLSQRVQCSVVAGTGLRGWSDGPADTATFDCPSGLCVLKDGSLLVADKNNHAIRRIAPRPGRKGLYVSTIMGCGRPGFLDGNCLSACLNRPTALALDSTGTVIVCDTGNHAIRALHPPVACLGSDAWTLTTLGGGPCPSFRDGHSSEARFASPSALLLLPDGRLLVSDTGNHVVRCVQPGGGSGGGGGHLRPRHLPQSPPHPQYSTCKEQQQRAQMPSSAFANVLASSSSVGGVAVVCDPGDKPLPATPSSSTTPPRHYAHTADSATAGVRAAAAAAAAGYSCLDFDPSAFTSPADVAAFHLKFNWVTTVVGSPLDALTAATATASKRNENTGDVTGDHSSAAAAVSTTGTETGTGTATARARYRDGHFSRACMRGPRGLALLPPASAAAGTVVLCDSNNNLLRLLVPRRVLVTPPPALKLLLPPSPVLQARTAKPPTNTRPATKLTSSATPSFLKTSSPPHVRAPLGTAVASGLLLATKPGVEREGSVGVTPGGGCCKSSGSRLALAHKAKLKELQAAKQAAMQQQQQQPSTLPTTSPRPRSVSPRRSVGSGILPPPPAHTPTASPFGASTPRSHRYQRNTQASAARLLVTGVLTSDTGQVQDVDVPATLGSGVRVEAPPHTQPQPFTSSTSSLSYSRGRQATPLHSSVPIPVRVTMCVPVKARRFAGWLEQRAHQEPFCTSVKFMAAAGSSGGKQTSGGSSSSSAAQPNTNSYSSQSGVSGSTLFRQHGPLPSTPAPSVSRAPEMTAPPSNRVPWDTPCHLAQSSQKACQQRRRHSLDPTTTQSFKLVQMHHPGMRGPSPSSRQPRQATTTSAAASPDPIGASAAGSSIGSSGGKHASLRLNANATQAVLAKFASLAPPAAGPPPPPPLPYNTTSSTSANTVSWALPLNPACTTASRTPRRRRSHSERRDQKR